MTMRPVGYRRVEPALACLKSAGLIREYSHSDDPDHPQSLLVAVSGIAPAFHDSVRDLFPNDHCLVAGKDGGHPERMPDASPVRQCATKEAMDRPTNMPPEPNTTWHGESGKQLGFTGFLVWLGIVAALLVPWLQEHTIRDRITDVVQQVAENARSDSTTVELVGLHSRFKQGALVLSRDHSGTWQCQRRDVAKSDHALLPESCLGDLPPASIWKMVGDVVGGLFLVLIVLFPVWGLLEELWWMVDEWWKPSHGQGTQRGSTPSADAATPSASPGKTRSRDKPGLRRRRIPYEQLTDLADWLSRPDHRTTTETSCWHLLQRQTTFVELIAVASPGASRFRDLHGSPRLRIHFRGRRECVIFRQPSSPCRGLGLHTEHSLLTHHLEPWGDLQIATGCRSGEEAQAAATLLENGEMTPGRSSDCYLNHAVPLTEILIHGGMLLRGPESVLAWGEAQLQGIDVTIKRMGTARRDTGHDPNAELHVLVWEGGFVVAESFRVEEVVPL
ncbi:MAG: hypothetical protein HQL50_08215 [Magnetococcales bacterium]|nr:hypothetical protein [Magnetococcales bacterium]